MEVHLTKRRSRPSRTKKFSIQSIASGEISHIGTTPKSGQSAARTSSFARGTVGESPTEITVSLSKSSLWTNSSLASAKEDASEASADSFIAYTDSYAYSPDDDSCVNYDPYLDSGRRRPTKPEPDIPQNNVIEDSLDDFETACTSLNRSPDQSRPRILHVPLRRSFDRDGSPSVSDCTSYIQDGEQAAQARKTRNYWTSVVTQRTNARGTFHGETAEAIFSLGHAHMRLGDFEEAMGCFRSAGRIWKSLNGPLHLSVGRALDAYGLAALRYFKGGPSLAQATKALDQAFAIRFHHLGVWHADTVETYNKMASVQLNMGNLQEACKSYEEVYLVRKAIFGADHPSVAISAHSLANVHMKLSDLDAAQQYFRIAMDIYKNLHLPKTHPTVSKLMNDKKRLKRARRDQLDGTS